MFSTNYYSKCFYAASHLFIHSLNRTHQSPPTLASDGFGFGTLKWHLNMQWGSLGIEPPNQLLTALPLNHSCLISRLSGSVPTSVRLVCAASWFTFQSWKAKQSVMLPHSSTMFFYSFCSLNIKILSKMSASSVCEEMKCCVNASTIWKHRKWVILTLENPEGQFWPLFFFNSFFFQLLNEQANKKVKLTLKAQKKIILGFIRVKKKVYGHH